VASDDCAMLQHPCETDLHNSQIYRPVCLMRLDLLVRASYACAIETEFNVHANQHLPAARLTRRPCASGSPPWATPSRGRGWGETLQQWPQV
jgi:hypothetical protein